MTTAESTVQRRRLAPSKAFLVFPAWAWLLFVFVLPVALVVYYSFGYKPDLFSTYATDELSLDRYREAMSETFLATFRHTLQIGVVGTFLALVVALPFAYWIGRVVSARRRPLLLALVLVPFWTNFLVRTVGWQIVLSPKGWLSDLLIGIGLRDDAIQLLYTREAVQIGVIYNYLPLMILPLYVALERIDPSLIEASKDLGASRTKTFLAVTLPQAMPGVAAALLLTFIPLMGDYITAALLGGAEGTMVGQQVAVQFQQGQNWALGSAMAVLLMVLILAATLGFAVIALVVRYLVRRSRRVDLGGLS